MPDATELARKQSLAHLSTESAQHREKLPRQLVPAGLKASEVAKKLGELWKSLPAEEKAVRRIGVA